MPAADLVVQGAQVRTLDPARPRAEGFAVLHGRFVAVGDAREAAAWRGPRTRVLDLAGRTVVPGFIDAHLHVLASGIRHVLGVDCSAGSVAEIQAALRARARETPSGEWIWGVLFDDTKIREQRMLTRDDLDAVSAAHPIFVSHRGFHSHMCNSQALQAAGVREDAGPPAGERWGRDPDTGRLDGVIHSRAQRIRDELLPKPTPSQRREGLARISRMLHAAGITSVHDAIVSAEDLATYQQARRDGDLTLRVAALLWHEHTEALASCGVRAGFGDEWLRLGGMKLVADGAIAGRTAWLTEPYVGTDDRGICAMDPRELADRVALIHRAGLRPCVHANGDAAIRVTLDAFERALAARPDPDARLRVEHCTVVDDRIVARLKRLGCVVTPFCTYVYHHGDKMRFYGPRRLERMFAMRSFLDAGVPATGASDYMPGPFEPLLGIQSCVTRTDAEGRTWGPSQRITVDEALAAYTRHGAYASFEERDKGAIEPGKLADFAVLAADPGAVDPSEIKDIPVDLTVVGGRVVHGE